MGVTGEYVFSTEVSKHKSDADHIVQASRKLQKLPPKAVTESGNEQAGGHIFDLDDDAEDLMSQENFRIKSAQSMPIALQGAPDAAVRDVCSHGAERSMHSSSSTGMPPITSTFSRLFLDRLP